MSGLAVDGNNFLAFSARSQKSSPVGADVTAAMASNVGPEVSGKDAIMPPVNLQQANVIPSGCGENLHMAA